MPINDVPYLSPLWYIQQQQQKEDSEQVMHGFRVWAGLDEPKPRKWGNPHMGTPTPEQVADFTHRVLHQGQPRGGLPMQDSKPISPNFEAEFANRVVGARPPAPMGVPVQAPPAMMALSAQAGAPAWGTTGPAPVGVDIGATGLALMEQMKRAGEANTKPPAPSLSGNFWGGTANEPASPRSSVWGDMGGDIASALMEQMKMAGDVKAAREAQAFNAATQRESNIMERLRRVDQADHAANNAKGYQTHSQYAPGGRFGTLTYGATPIYDNTLRQQLFAEDMQQNAGQQEMLRRLTIAAQQRQHDEGMAKQGHQYRLAEIAAEGKVRGDLANLNNQSKLD